MKYLLGLVLILSTASIYSQRNYSTTQITTIHGALNGTEGDLYMDTILNELYIGLQNGQLYKLTSTDNQRIDVSTFTAAGINLSLERDGEATKIIPIISTSPNNDISFNSDGLYLNETDNQNLSLGVKTGNNLPLNISGGTGVVLNIADADSLTTNELQTISKAGSLVSLSLGGGSFIDAVNDLDSVATNEGVLGVGAGTATSSVLLSNTAGQSPLSIIAGTGLSITESTSANGGSITITNASTNTDSQNLSLGARTGNNQVLNISGGTGVTINVADPDSSTTNEIQTLSRSGDLVSLSLGGGSFTDDHLGTANQTLSTNRIISMSGRSLTFDGTQDVIIEADGDMGIGTTTPGAKLDVDNGSVRFSDYGTGTYLDTLGSVSDGVHLLAVDNVGNVIETNTYKSAQVFYPPAVVIDVSTLVTNATLDLYQEYINAMGSPVAGSSAEPIPTYSRSELKYYLLNYDTSVFNIGPTDVSSTGVLTYDVIAVPAGNCSFLNVVFVVK